MPTLVDVCVIVALMLAARFRRDHSGCATRVQFFEEPIRIERLVRQKRPERDVADQRGNPLHVMRLTGQQQEADQIAERVHQRDDLGRQAAVRTPDGRQFLHHSSEHCQRSISCLVSFSPAPSFFGLVRLHGKDASFLTIAFTSFFHFQKVISDGDSFFKSTYPQPQCVKYVLDSVLRCIWMAIYFVNSNCYEPRR